MRNFHFHIFTPRVFLLVNISFFYGLLISIKFAPLTFCHALSCICSHSNCVGHFFPFLFKIYILFWQVLPGFQKGKTFRRATRCWLESKSSTALIGCFYFMPCLFHLMYDLLQKYYFYLQSYNSTITTLFFLCFVLFFSQNT